MATTEDSRKATLGLDFTSILGNSNITGSGVLTSALVTVDGELLVKDSSGGGGGGSTQYDMGDAIGTTPTGTVALGRDGSGNAQALQVSASGNQFVELADFIKGNTNMANSFCVNIANDQPALIVEETFLRATQNINFTVPASSNNTSAGVNMSPAGDPTYRQIAFFGETDNITDLEIYVQFSNDNSNWYTCGPDDVIQLAIDPLDATKQTFYKAFDSPPQWVRLLKLNSTGSLETLSVKTARIN